MPETIRKTLFLMQDLKYRQFQAGLLPTVNPEMVIGVRTPLLKKLAKEMRGSEETELFLTELPHKYYEENNLHAFIIALERDFEKCVDSVEHFLPYIDNWATCDSLRPRCFANNTERLLARIKEWIVSDKTYTVRFGIEMLMLYYLDDNFSDEYAWAVEAVQSDDYYVKMMVAWYFATALAKQYDRIIPIIEGERLSTWVHNKTIQKAIESYRISDERKEYLKKLRRR